MKNIIQCLIVAVTRGFQTLVTTETQTDRELHKTSVTSESIKQLTGSQHTMNTPALHAVSDVKSYGTSSNF